MGLTKVWCLPKQISGLCLCTGRYSQLIIWLPVIVGPGPCVLEPTTEASGVPLPTCDPLSHVMNRREHCRRQFCPDLGAVKSWPKRYHPRGHFPGPLAYRGLGRELEQAAPWALCRIFEQSHRLGWAGHQKETEPLALSQVMECQLDWFFSSSTRDPPCLLGVVSFQAQPLPSLGPPLQRKKRLIHTWCSELSSPCPCRAAPWGGWDRAIQLTT